MVENYYYGLRERQYKYIQPAIVVERLLQDEAGQVPLDFKFHCFNYGNNIEVIVRITLDRFESPKNIFFDENWNQLDIEYGFPNAPDSWDFTLGEKLIKTGILNQKT